MQQGEFAIEESDEEFSDAVFTIDTLIQFEAEFVGIDRAIEALQQGTYGQCEVCSVTIAQARLRDDPVLIRCDAHLVRETPTLFATESEADNGAETDTEATDLPSVTTVPEPCATYTSSGAVESPEAQQSDSFGFSA
jgi:hypothetical protein